MRKNSRTLILLLMISILITISCDASDVSKINDLIENSVGMDKKEVTVQGEVIGEALKRGDYAWINISDTTNAIGIWVKKSNLDQIQFFGDFKTKGDIIKVTGVFYRACSEHGGDVDIHSYKIEIAETGYKIREQLPLNKIIVAIILVFISICFIIVYLKLRKIAYTPFLSRK